MNSNLVHKVLRSFLLLLFALFISDAIAGNDRRKVSLLTCSPGEEVYSLFGHTAIRVSDPDRDIDCVFNYGLFSFNEPNFIWRFVLGETDYLLGTVDYDAFLFEYAMRGSGVTEQVLALDSIQKNSIINALVVNSYPRNRKYRYNFLFNNCTTKARDRIFEVYAPQYGISYSNPSQGDTMSFRQIIHNHTIGYPWYEFSMDLLLGADADKIAMRSGAQFAPLLFMDELAGAHIKDSLVSAPIVAQQNELLVAQPRIHSRNNLTPFNVALLLLLFTFVVMLCEKRSKKSFWGWDILLMSMQGIVGILLLFMVLFSQHPAVGENWLLVWLNPLPLLLLPVLIYRIKKGLSLNFMWIQVVMVASFILLSPFMPQEFSSALYPCAAALIVRSLFHIYKNNICALD